MKAVLESTTDCLSNAPKRKSCVTWFGRYRHVNFGPLSGRDISKTACFTVKKYTPFESQFNGGDNAVFTFHLAYAV